MNKVKHEIFEWVQAILITLVIFLIYNFFFATTTDYNTSMYPTLVEKDMLFMVKFGSDSNPTSNTCDNSNYYSNSKYRGVFKFYFLSKFS